MEAPTTKTPIKFFFEDTDLSPLEIIERDYEWYMDDIRMICKFSGSEELKTSRRYKDVEAKYKDTIRGLERGYYVIENRTLYELSYGE